VQDLAIVVEGIADAMDDDEDDGVILRILENWAKDRIVQAATGFAVSITISAVVGVGGKALGAFVGRLAKRQITKAGIDRARAWFKDYKRANANKLSRNGKVQFNENGWPDFRPYLYKGSGNTIRLSEWSNQPADFAAANEAFKRINGFYPDLKKYVWHHHQNLHDLQLVEREVHASVGHTGGVKLWEVLTDTVYRRK
jgi:hypothetical protein